MFEDFVLDLPVELSSLQVGLKQGRRAQDTSTGMGSVGRGRLTSACPWPSPIHSTCSTSLLSTLPVTM